MPICAAAISTAIFTVAPEVMGNMQLAYRYVMVSMGPNFGMYAVRAVLRPGAELRCHCGYDDPIMAGRCDRLDGQDEKRRLSGHPDLFWLDRSCRSKDIFCVNLLVSATLRPEFFIDDYIKEAQRVSLKI